jgi:hypothetical protein
MESTILRRNSGRRSWAPPTKPAAPAKKEEAKKEEAKPDAATDAL